MADIIAKMESSKFLKSLFDAVAFLIDETAIKFRPGGIEFGAIDSSRVAMLLAKIPKEFFASYQYSVKETSEDAKGKTKDKLSPEFKININVQDLIKILRRAKATDTLELSRDTAVGNQILIIRMVSEKSSRTFKIKGKDSSTTEDVSALAGNFVETLKDKFTANFMFPISLLDETVKDALIISDLLNVNISKDGNAVFSAVEDVGEVATEIDLKSDESLWKPAITGAANGIYSLGFLENILKIQSIVDTVSVSLGQNIPVLFKGSFKSNGDDNAPPGTIDYLLAPRVDDENKDDEFSDEDMEFSDDEATSGDDEEGGDEE